MKRREFVKLTLPNDLSYLPVARACVREAAQKFAFAGGDLDHIDLALEEAVSNVIEHAFDAGEESTFDLIVESFARGLRLIIKEKGIPFDPSLLPRYNPEKVLEEGTSGMGMFLMQEVMDEVSFRNLGPEGKETHLIKFRRDKNIEECLPAAELAPEPQAPPPLARKIDYDIRGILPGEAIEISRCAYKTHGYTFFDDHIYYPERVMKRGKSAGGKKTAA